MAYAFFRYMISSGSEKEKSGLAYAGLRAHAIERFRATPAKAPDNDKPPQEQAKTTGGGSEDAGEKSTDQSS
jgi:hypothetical protein